MVLGSTRMSGRCWWWTALLWCTVVLCGGWAAETVVAQTAPTTALSTHVFNATLAGADAGSNWPSTTDALNVLATVVNSTVCGSLTAAIANCSAFLMRASSATLGLQLRVLTTSVVAGNVTYAQLTQWADSSSGAIAPVLANLTALSATALGTSLTALTFSAGFYTMPCRGSLTYTYLPSCAAAEIPVTSVFVLAPLTDVGAYFQSYLCGASASTTCANGIVTQPPSPTEPYTVVNITGLPKALEAVLAYVADVRANYVGSAQGVGPSVGNPGSGVGAAAVELRYRGIPAVLFSQTENNRTFSKTTRMTLQCQASFGYWAFSLISVLPIGGILFRYVWYRGRHQAKKEGRLRIVQDETRIMQGYPPSMNPPGTDGGAPPPGVDTDAGANVNGFTQRAPRWVMDENGNYHDAGVVAYEAGTAEGMGETEAVSYETYVDPNTGETYQYVAAAGAEDTADPPIPQTFTAEPEAYTTYQTYVDPVTGEAYQYAVDTHVEGELPFTEAAVSVEQGEAVEDAGAAAEAYQTYVDPDTGEMYQYVDPTTGEVYQYTAETEQAEGGTPQ